MSFSISDMDRGFKEVRRKFAALNVKPYVKIGVQGTEAEARKEARTPEGGNSLQGITVVEVATFHEFGTSNVPQRSFLRDTIDEKQRSYMRIAQVLSGEIIDGKRDPIQALNLLGEKIKTDVVQRITDGIPPELAPETIERKGSDVPLIDTGQLRQSISYAVEKKGKAS
jgi:phage gpG-like protein